MNNGHLVKTNPIKPNFSPKTPDGYGKSLTRIDPNDYGNDIINWDANDPSPGE